MEYYNEKHYPDPTPYHALTKQFRKRYTICYICSAFRGDIERNTEKARKYCKFALKKECMPIAPHLLFPQFMDDNNANERELALLFNQILIPKCDELWVFGEPTDGMLEEIRKAKRAYMKVRHFNTECQEVVYNA